MSPVYIRSKTSQIIVQLVFYHFYQNHSGIFYMSKVMSRIYYFEKNSAANILYEKSNEVLDNGGSSGTLLVDILKVFDYIVHDLLLAKVSACGFDCIYLN